MLQFIADLPIFNLLFSALISFTLYIFLYVSIKYMPLMINISLQYVGIYFRYKNITNDFYTIFFYIFLCNI